MTILNKKESAEQPTTSTTPSLKETTGSLDYSNQAWSEALLQSVVTRHLLMLGAAPNSPIDKAMTSLAQEVWALAEKQAGQPQPGAEPSPLPDSQEV